MVKTGPLRPKFAPQICAPISAPCFGLSIPGEPPLSTHSVQLHRVLRAPPEKIFTAVCQGGQVHMPLGKTFWSACFGRVEDQFGVGWIVTTG